ncbi:MAG TPA: GNAT family N-acetyltransferase [Candidatus Limnocylindria bacterium]
MTTATLNTVSSTSTRLRLDDDRWVTIRPIESSDADGLFDFYTRLSPRARVSRFLGASAGIARPAATAFASADHVGSDGIVAILREPGPADGEVVGHACLEPDDAGGEEVALAVADGYRGRGIGKALMAAAVRSARRRGVHRLSAMLLATNQPMRQLMVTAGSHIASDHIEAGIEEIEVELAA